MLGDTNRTGVYTRGGAGVNIVGSGSDGTAYWSLFNVEGESSIPADYVTYDTLADMLGDTNRTGVYTRGGAGVNIVGSGAIVLSPVPIPGALWLFGSALLAAFGFSRTNRVSVKYDANT